MKKVDKQEKKRLKKKRKLSKEASSINRTTRAFLNSGHQESDASVFTQIHNSAWTDTAINLNANVQLRDCSRKITLDISLDSKEAFDNSLFKLDTLAKELKEFRDHLAENRKIIEKHYYKD